MECNMGINLALRLALAIPSSSFATEPPTAHRHPRNESDKSAASVKLERSGSVVRRLPMFDKAQLAVDHRTLLKKA